MKRIVLIVLLLATFTVDAQKIINTDHDFRAFVYHCLDSLEKKNINVYKEIRGIQLTTNLHGKLMSYKMHFSSKEINLSKKEYRWLFNILKQANYREYQKGFYYNIELPPSKEVKLGIKFIQKEKRDW